MGHGQAGQADRDMMALALGQARISLETGGVPVGAVLAAAGRGQVVAAGHNERVQRGDPVAHGEIACLRNAGRRPSYQDTTLYTTLSPCQMCSGAILLFQIPRVVVGEAQTFEGDLGFLAGRGVDDRAARRRGLRGRHAGVPAALPRGLERGHRRPLISDAYPRCVIAGRPNDAYMQVPSQVEYERATSVEHALSLLSRPDARVVAGGHSLIPMMKLRLAQPGVLVDINGLAELAYIRLDGDQLRIGALARHADLLDSAVAGEHFPIFHDAERVVADPIVRLWGTVGGSLCQADPSEDLSAAFAATHATAVIRGQDGDRVVPVREFHLGPYETVIGPGELLAEVRVPVRPGTGSAYEKVARRVGDWSVAAAGAVLRLRGSRTTGHRGGGPRPDRGRRRALRGGRGRGVPPRPPGRPSTPSKQPPPSPPSTVIPSPTSAGPRTTSGTWSPSSPPARSAGPAERAGWRTMTMRVAVTVNGTEYAREVEPRLLLIHFLRDELGLTGSHWGCDTSNCGSCVVWLDARPVKSCTVLAAMADGRSVRTVEDLERDGQLDPVQQGFIECHGLQCGFCTPGMMMTARWLLDHHPDPDEAEIREAISGQICRCTGYENIVRSVRWAAEHPADHRGETP